MVEHGRRRFLKTASVGMTAAIAGCASSGDAPAQSSTEDRVTVTVGIEPDRDAIQASQQELVSEVEAGNVTRSEAAAQFSEERSRILSEAAADAQKRLESEGVEIEAVDEEASLLRATGDPATLVGMLTDDRISAILEASAYDDLTESSGDGTTTPDGNTTAGDTTADGNATASGDTTTSGDTTASGDTTSEE